MTTRSEGHFIKQWRQSMQMTQKEFAAYVGLSPSNYNYLERGEIGYTQTSLETIARALEITPAMLLSVNPLDPVDDDEGDEPTMAHQAMRMIEGMNVTNQMLSLELLRAVMGFEARRTLPALRAKIAARQKKS